MGTKKKIFLITAGVLAFIIVGVFLGVLITQVGAVALFAWDLSQNEMENEHLAYYQDIKGEIRWKVNPTITLDQTFDFAWDCAYVQEDAGMPPEELDAILGFESGVWPLDVWWGFPCRVIFIKDSQVVFEFKYDSDYIDFAEKEVFIYPDTEFKVSRQGRKIILN